MTIIALMPEITELMKRLVLPICLCVVLNLLFQPLDQASAQESTITHIMQPGESLLDVELFYGLTGQELAASNTDTPLLTGTGRGVNVPAPFANGTDSSSVHATTSYVVQRGDTLFRIATRFNIGMDLLAAANQIVWFDRIYVGQVLTIPGEGYILPSKSDALANTVAPLPADTIPEPTILDGKQIVVVLGQQHAYAFENGVLLRHFVVSTGLPKTPTVLGDYQVYAKYEAQRMVGPGYDLPGVPWVMYFYQGYALHGTYWHNNFGHPMSHGCVNMRTPEAEWLYAWAPIGTGVRVIP